MLHRFDFKQFDVYGLSHKTVNDIVYIKPHWTKGGKRSKQWSNVKTKRGKAILDYATAGDITLLYEDEPVLAQNVLKQISYFTVYDGDRTGDTLYDEISPLAVDDNKLILNIGVDGEFRRFDMAKIITEKTKRGEFFTHGFRNDPRESLGDLSVVVTA